MHPYIAFTERHLVADDRPRRFVAGAVAAKPARRPAAWMAIAWLLAVAAPLARADAASDDALLRFEQASSFYARMASTAQIDRPLLEVAESKPRSAVRARGIDAAKEAYSVKDAMAGMRSTLDAPGAGVAAGRLPEIATRMEAIQASIDRKSFEELRAVEKQWTARYRARADRRKIDAVVAAMAAPRLAGETAVTLRRVKWVYETLIIERPERLRAVAPAEFEAGLKAILTRTRGPDHDGQPPPLRKDVLEQMWRERMRVALSQLAAEEVAELHRFYADARTGAKVVALETAFRAQNDADGLEFMNRMFEEARAR